MIYDHVVVGGGIVGASTARHLLAAAPGSSLLLLDKERTFGPHQTGHNSGVIHSGIYYAPGQPQGRDVPSRGPSHRGVRPRARHPRGAHRQAPRRDHDARELAGLGALRERAAVNRIEAEVIDGPELRRREPHVTGLGALSVPSTGITDFRPVNRAFADDVRAGGGELRTATAVTGVHESADEVLLETTTGEVRARHVVFCAGRAVRPDGPAGRHRRRLPDRAVPRRVLRRRAGRRRTWSATSSTRSPTRSCRSSACT